MDTNKAKGEVIKMENKKSNVVMGIVIFLAGLMILMSCGSSSPIVRAYDKLDKSGDHIWIGEYSELAEDGSYLSVDTNPIDEDDYSLDSAIRFIVDMNDELKLPESVTKRMGETRSMDGIQSYTGDSVKVQWTYHPGRGLEVMYEPVK